MLWCAVLCCAVLCCQGSDRCVSRPGCRVLLLAVCAYAGCAVIGGVRQLSGAQEEKVPVLPSSRRAERRSSSAERRGGVRSVLGTAERRSAWSPGRYRQTPQGGEGRARALIPALPRSKPTARRGAARPIVQPDTRRADCAAEPSVRLTAAGSVHQASRPAPPSALLTVAEAQTRSAGMAWRGRAHACVFLFAGVRSLRRQTLRVCARTQVVRAACPSRPASPASPSSPSPRPGEGGEAFPKPAGALRGCSGKSAAVARGRTRAPCLR